MLFRSTYVQIAGLEIISINTAGSNVTAEDAAGHVIDIRIDSDTGFTAADFGLTVGQIVTVNGPLGYYDFAFDTPEGYLYLRDRFQVMLTTAADIMIEE